MQINIKLDKNFTTVFNKLCEEYGENLQKLNGFSDSQLNYTDFIDNFIDKNVKTVADASIDGNANASTRDITSLEIEMSKPHSKLLAFNKIFFELNKKYGYKVAQDWLQNEWDGHFYLHDAFSSTFKSYCFAYDIEELVKKGLYFIDTFNNQPPKHLTTYVDFIGEFVSWTSNRTSGACGLPSFLIYSYYFWKKDIETDYQGLKTSVVPGWWNGVKRLLGLMKKKDAEYRKKMQNNYRDQEFQRIIYKLNQPYLRVTQSAFTNFSIFDESYLVEIFGGKKFPDGTPMIDHIDEIKDYQKRFMEVCSDIRSQNMMTFSVLTYALLRDENGNWADEEYAKWCCKHNMQWADSNFFVSKDVTSLSNCCVDGNSVIFVYNTITNEEEIFLIKDFIALFDDSDEEFIKSFETNYKVKSFNYETCEFEFKDIQGLIRKKNDYEFMFEFEIDDKIIKVTPDHIMKVKYIKTGEIKDISASLLYKHIDDYEILIEE